MRNYVDIIGLCISIQKEYIVLKMFNEDLLTIYFNESGTNHIIDVFDANKMTREEGHLKPFETDVVIYADSVFQLKNNCSS